MSTSFDEYLDFVRRRICRIGMYVKSSGDISISQDTVDRFAQEVFDYVNLMPVNNMNYKVIKKLKEINNGNTRS